MKKIIHTSLIVAGLMAVAGVANAADLCKAYDKSQWLSQEEITKKVTAMGYEARKVQPEDGCWEVKGTKDGKRVEAYFDPVTAELVTTK